MQVLDRKEEMISQCIMEQDTLVTLSFARGKLNASDSAVFYRAPIATENDA